jgi:hypothetical protein
MRTSGIARAASDDAKDAMHRRIRVELEEA